MKTQHSEAHFEDAKKWFPGGVNSPVRAFRSVGGTPLFMKAGDGCYITDADDNRYIDFCCSWGPLILGHNHADVRKSIIEAVNKGTSFGAPTVQENELASLILEHHRYLEKLRFVSSGTEAVMSALRLARGFTGRDKVIKFEGCYHGHSDALLVKAGSGLATSGRSDSAGVPEAFAQETIVLPLNDREAVAAAVARYKGEIACIVIEPIPANNGLLLQDKAFLSYLREVCTQEGILLFFDEVISGFRVGFEGAAGHYGISPDLITFGKIIGGGMPVGAYGGSKEIMGHIAPEGAVYQAGTLSGNPVAMCAGAAQLKACLVPGFYEELEQRTQDFVNRIRQHAEAKKYPFKVFSLASIFWLAFTDADRISAAHHIQAERMQHFKVFFHALLEKGIYMGPSGYEVGFVSAAHSPEILAEAASVFCEALDVVFADQMVSL